MHKQQTYNRKVPGSNRMRKGSKVTRQTKFVISWIAVAFWACFIFSMSANTGDGLNSGDGIVSLIFCALHEAQAALLGSDVDIVSICAHFCEYTIFGALLVNALHYHMPLKKALIFALLCGSLYGVSDEFHQYFVPDRACDPFDWLTDTCGSLFGAWLMTRWFVHKKSVGEKSQHTQ